MNSGDITSGTVCELKTMHSLGSLNMQNEIKLFNIHAIDLFKYNWSDFACIVTWDLQNIL